MMVKMAYNINLDEGVDVVNEKNYSNPRTKIKEKHIKAISQCGSVK